MALGLVLCAGMVSADDWGQWRGPRADGISRETGWNPEALNGSLRVLWRAGLGMGHSTVSVQDGRLYTMGEREVSRGGKTTWEDVVYCLDARTGKEIWRYAYPVESQRWPGPGSTPVFGNGLLCTLSREGHLHCFDAATGSVRWRRHLVEDGLTEVPQWGFCGSALVLDDRVILNAGRSGIALAAATGKVIWKSEPEAGSLATPLLLESNDPPTVVIAGRTTLFAVDVATGEVRWEEPYDSYADPVVVGQSILLSTDRTRGHQGVRLMKIAPSGAETVWRTNRRNYAFQSSVVIDNHSYGFNRDRTDSVECIDLANGEVKWSEGVGDWGSLAAAGDKLIIIKGDGELVIADADHDGYKVISKARVFQLQPWRSYPDGRPDTCWSAPVLANGKIYARTTHGSLVCVDVKG